MSEYDARREAEEDAAEALERVPFDAATLAEIEANRIGGEPFEPCQAREVDGEWVGDGCEACDAREEREALGGAAK